METTPERVIEWAAGVLQVARHSPEALPDDEELEKIRESLEDVRLHGGDVTWEKSQDLVVELPDGRCYKLTLTISEIDPAYR